MGTVLSEKSTQGLGMRQGTSRAVKNMISEIDLWMGACVSLEALSYTTNPNTVDAGSGVETAKDWSNTRRKGSLLRGTDGTELDTDDKYVRYIFGVESMNLIDALSLAKVFDLSHYQSIFEIGCGDLAQAFVIHRLYPHIRYVATDLDPYVIDRCEQLSVLKGIEKRVLDVRSVSDQEIPFAGFDLLMSWGMEYALDDEQLLRLLHMVRRTGVPYLMCSATAIGPMQYARYCMGASRRRVLIDQNKLRMTGWRRSVGKFHRLAQQAGLKTEPLGQFGYHFCMLLNPF